MQVPQPQNTLSHLLILSDIVPASLMENFIFLDIKIKEKKPPRVTAKAQLFTSNKHVKAYNNKIEKQG